MSDGDGMRLLREIKVNIGMVFRYYGFYISIFAVFLLCFTSTIYTNTQTMENYSVIDVIIKINRSSMLKNTAFCSYYVSCAGTGGWLSMFIPITASVAFIPMLCDEKISRYTRAAVLRNGKTVYYSGKFITAILAGGLSTLIGYLLYVVVVYIIFPSIREYPQNMREGIKQAQSMYFLWWKGEVFSKTIIPKLVGVFLYGIFMAVPAVSCSIFSHNKYIVICIPFFIKYAVTQTCIKILMKATGNYEHINETAEKFSMTVNPDSVANAFQTENTYKTLTVYFILTALVFIIYLLQLRWRYDCGT